MRAGAESPLVIVYGHHMSDGTMFAPLAQYSSRDFAEGTAPSGSTPGEKAIELEVFAADVVDASSEGKRTDFADAAALAAYLGDKLSRCEVSPGRAFGRRAGLGLRDVQLPDEQLAHRRLREGGGRMGFAPFGIGLLMGLLTLTAYACCAAGDDDDDRD